MESALVVRGPGPQNDATTNGLGTPAKEGPKEPDSSQLKKLATFHISFGNAKIPGPVPFYCGLDESLTFLRDEIVKTINGEPKKYWFAGFAKDQCNRPLKELGFSVNSDPNEVVLNRFEQAESSDSDEEGERGGKYDSCAEIHWQKLDGGEGSIPSPVDRRTRIVEFVHSQLFEEKKLLLPANSYRFLFEGQHLGSRLLNSLKAGRKYEVDIMERQDGG